MSWGGKTPCSAGSYGLSQQGVWEAYVLYSGEGLLGQEPAQPWDQGLFPKVSPSY